MTEAMTARQHHQTPRPGRHSAGTNIPNQGPTPEIYRLPAVVATCGISRSTICEMIQRGDIPAPVKLGARAVGRRRSDIEVWLESRPAA